VGSTAGPPYQQSLLSSLLPIGNQHPKVLNENSKNKFISFKLNPILGSVLFHAIPL
jgi:hypothetical protein